MSMLQKDARSQLSVKRTVVTVDRSSNDDDDPTAKRVKMTTSAESSSSQDVLYSKLDPKDPVQAKRLEQRRKMIAKGKNTAGYDAYLQQIPKHKRRPRSMETPATPDHTLDIPNKRWQGLVKAWRVALHKYDPPDLVVKSKPETSETTPATAAAIATPPTSTPNRKKNDDTSAFVDLEETTPISIAASPSNHTPVGRSLNYDLDDIESEDDDDLL